MSRVVRAAILQTEWTGDKESMRKLGDIYRSGDGVAKDYRKAAEWYRKAAEAGEIGMKYLISPYEGAQKTIADYKKIADKFNKK